MSYITDFLRRIDFKNLNTRLYLRQRELAKFIKERRTIKLLHLVRKYSAFAVVVSSAILVSATNAASGKGAGGFLFGYWDTPVEAAATTNSSKINGQINKKNDLAMVPLAKASTSVDPGAKVEDFSQPIISGQGIIANVGGANPMKDPEQDGGVNMYVVQSGDTLGSIAAKNKVSVNTILWANDIDNADQIKPGDTLFILPVSGIQYTVKQGDSIDSLATKFKADKEKIISFNDLPANGDLEIGKEIVIPDGQGEVSAPQNPSSGSTNNSGTDDSIIGKRQYANSQGGTPEVSSGNVLGGKPGAGHKFPYGYCTWYVAQKRNVPWSGNAGTWIYHAKAGGYATGRTPRAGSIMVTTENRYYGHVAYVEKVNGNTITVSEMNYVGFGKVSRRTLSATDRAIKGFIY